MNVDIENVVVFFALVELLATLSNSIYDIPNLLPSICSAIPLRSK